MNERALKNERKRLSFVDYRWPLPKRNAHAAKIVLACTHARHDEPEKQQQQRQASNKRRSYELCIEWIFMSIGARADGKTNEPHARHHTIFGSGVVQTISIEKSKKKTYERKSEW